MDALPKISIVMPSYNCKAFIREAIQSVLNQDYPNFELIVMDGASTDGTLEILRSISHPSFRWFSGPDKGQSDAINKGFQLAEGEILGWLNADDLYEAGCFRRVGSYFHNHPECMWLSGKCSIIDEKGQEIRKWISRYKTWKLHHYSYHALLAENFLSQMATFFRKSAWDAVGPLDVNCHYAMDYDLWLRLGRNYPLHVLPMPLAKFRMYSGTKSMQGFRKQFEEDFAVAKRYVGQKKHLLALHYFHNCTIVALYSLMAFASKLKIHKNRLST